MAAAIKKWDRSGHLRGLALSSIVTASCSGGGASTLDVGADADADADADTSAEGPPVVRQVLMGERMLVANNLRLLEGQLAFGQHSAPFFESDDGVVTDAAVLSNQEVRIILSKAVVGLEEVGCADGDYSTFPDSATPADFAACAGPPGSPMENCKNICLDPATRVPIGILDVNQDGVPDEFRMRDYDPSPDVIELGVSIICDGVSMPLDRHRSSWNSSGSQVFPSNGDSYAGLGPAIVLYPVHDIGFRTGSSCGIEFRDEITDGAKMPCAPEGGLPSNGCDAGDTSRIHFNTEPLYISNSVPSDGANNVGLDESQFMFLAFSAYIKASSIGAITLTADGAAVAIDSDVSAAERASIFSTLDGEFSPNTVYELTIGTGLEDEMGGSLDSAHKVSWTTSAN